jgi:hypothetical protein
MDPASILAIVGGVCTVVKGCIETWETWSSYRQQKKYLAIVKNVKDEEDKLSQELESSAPKVQEQYNQLVVALGSRFTRNGDGWYSPTYSRSGLLKY